MTSIRSVSHTNTRPLLAANLPSALQIAEVELHELSKCRNLFRWNWKIGFATCKCFRGDRSFTSATSTATPGRFIRSLRGSSFVWRPERS